MKETPPALSVTVTPVHTRRITRAQNMQQAKRYFLGFLRECGDARIATHRISRSPKTVLGYRAQDPEFAAAWDEAQRFHDEIQTHRLKGETTKAVDVVIDGLHQTEDRRLAVAIAEKRIAKSGIEEGPAPETPRRSGPAVSVIVIMQQEAAEAIPAESTVLDDEP